MVNRPMTCEEHEHDSQCRDTEHMSQHSITSHMSRVTSPEHNFSPTIAAAMDDETETIEVEDDAAEADPYLMMDDQECMV